MTAQVKALAAPQLKEAVNGVLHVGKLEGNAHGLVSPYQYQTTGDVVALHVKTSTGNSFEEQTIVTEAGVGRPLTFAIPKDVFEKKLVPQATAELHYIVKRVGQNPETSNVLKVHLEK
ncbi:hypothetical protein PS925_00141 [Pseudomonas fluorescens]|uniref:Uncharacterized protein n=1 Tax=Pseudomonas fluorescens TaxID=294 RepID=A0A5E7RTZ0_PSEFL|nr:hypothetical protein [Pseudomonas fluorescens]VVP77334.1 hypothetical protein PS925_00141 [Pseudomonas fluorescens]